VVILNLLHAAARGAFPPENGRTEVVGAAAGAPQVAAANAASLRALQPAGFAAVGAEVLFERPTDFLRRS